MDSLTAAAASGLRSRLETLDLLANNVANSASPGFKADKEFYNIYLSAEAADSTDGGVGSVLPVVEGKWTDWSQGVLNPTANPFDISLSGRGFFVASSPSGPLLTRGGTFRISSNGDLQTRDGFAVQDRNGRNIQLDNTVPLEVTGEGMVRQNGQDVAQLDIVDAKNTSALRKHGLNYFELSVADRKPADLAQTTVQQGKTETSNVQPAESAVRLISVSRQFEMLQHALTIGGDMNRQAVEEVAKV